MRKTKIKIIGYGLDQPLWRKHFERLHGPVTDGDPPLRKEVNICKNWLQEWVSKRKTINTNHSSYGLKHTIEEMFEDKNQFIYVGNGAFIQAAAELGYDIQPCMPDSPNAFFNMSFEKVKKYARKNKKRFNCIG